MAFRFVSILMQAFDSSAIEQMAQRYRAHFINSLSGFKSANLLGTVSDSGQTNVAMVSSVFHLGADPALMGMIMRPHTVRRDSLENIQAMGFYTLNHVNEAIYQQAHQTSARYDQAVSEFDAVGLSAEFIDGIPAPFVAESRLQIGLKLEQIVPVSVNQTEMVIGRVCLVRVAADMINAEGVIDIAALGTVAVSGLDTYNSCTRLARLSYAKPDAPLKALT